MKRIFLESTIILSSIIKWVFISISIGVIVGSSTTFFVKILDYGTLMTNSYSPYYFYLPIGLLLSTLIVSKFAPQAEGHGTERVIEALHKKSGKIDIKVIPIKLIATVITIICGGSAGKEGPSAQIGAGIASNLASILRFDDIDRKKIVICGISAGFSAVFGTPIAGALFAIEVLSIGKILYDVMLPSIIAGVIGYEVSTYFGVEHFHSYVSFTNKFSNSFFFTTIISGIFFGICSILLIELLNIFKLISEKIKFSMPVKALIGGALLSINSSLFSTKYLGLGINTIGQVLQNKPIEGYGFIIKAINTSITLNFGGSGGILTPIFFIGASSGAFFSHIFSLPQNLFAAIGVVALLSGTTNTPIASCILGIEMFGTEITSYMAVASVISFMMSGHRSVYPSQQIAFTKSSSIDIELDSEIEIVKSNFVPKSVIVNKLYKKYNRNSEK